MRSSTSSRRPVAAVRTASTRGTTRRPRRHQVTEVPRIAAHITEYRCHRRHCPACGTRTVAAVPDECAGQFGPQLAALIAYLTVVCRLPRLVVQRLLADVCRFRSAWEVRSTRGKEASAAVAAPYKELRQALANQPVLNADETGHRTNGATRWLWTLVAQPLCSIPSPPRVEPTSCGTCWARPLPRPGQRPIVDVPDVSRRPSPILLGAFPAQSPECAGPGDNGGSQALLSRGPDAAAAAVSAVASLPWRSPHARCPTHARAVVAKVLPIEKCLFALAERYVNAPDVKVSNLARALFVHHAHFFTFVHEEAVAPTNNVAERALRTAVQCGEIMFGNRSAEASAPLPDCSQSPARVNCNSSMCSPT